MGNETAERAGDGPRVHPVVWVVAFWGFYGVLVGNQIYLSMPDHNHTWGKLVGWQVASAMGWAALTPLLLAIGRRYPLQPRLVRGAVHLVAAFVVAAAHVVPATLFSMAIDPYTPIADAEPFVDEYLFQLDQWLLLDVLVYLCLVALGTGIETRRRELREAELRADLAQAELRALRLELQPHFLFNALNAVAGLLRSGAIEEAERMLIGLSDLLRATLDSTGRPLVTVAEEMRLAELYLEIQRVRFGDRLGVRFEIEPGVESLAVPNLVLQPVVENAVHHGVAGRREGGRVEVRAGLRRGRLVLSVADDGPGLAAEWSGSLGYGLDNVSSRLDAAYDGDWDLEIGSGEEGGAVVEISVPARALPLHMPAVGEALPEGDREPIGAATRIAGAAR